LQNTSTYIEDVQFRFFPYRIATMVRAFSLTLVEKTFRDDILPATDLAAPAHRNTIGGEKQLVVETRITAPEIRLEQKPAAIGVSYQSFPKVAGD
jgi:hypothetical protein